MTEQMTTPPSVARQESSAKWYIAIVVAIVVSAGAGLFAGMQIGKASNGSGMQGMDSMSGQRGGSGMMRGGFGTVTTVSDSSVTIESRMMRMGQGDSDSNSEGSTTTYKITSDTKVTNNGEAAAISDIKTGDTVRVETSNSSSDTATTIELNPQMRGGPGAGTQGTSQSSESGDSSQNG
ncbi:hypothetical protein GII36_03215 [Candidatus Mycosynbacter amalyticus]|uniref:DUF5666 domain-containing protein n=1 Tax=Candidatus Mycosynbacter amalyticus TaxID=2665156 RepID=A0A857MNL8_9BACT|nr:hypothetical protein [Candidatus Mycosynbacter amalyticus]QHN42849.1 hypothetical protein GII36_03215 [Candidatus Mycosynbacter amalyticus]